MPIFPGMGKIQSRLRTKKNPQLSQKAGEAEKSFYFGSGRETVKSFYFSSGRGTKTVIQDCGQKQVMSQAIYKWAKTRKTAKQTKSITRTVTMRENGLALVYTETCLMLLKFHAHMSVFIYFS